MRQWICSSVWQAPKIDFLREQIEELTSRAAIDRWISIAVEEGLDPL